MGFSKSELLEMSKAVPMWWHSIDLGQGVVTDGAQSADVLAKRVQSLNLPDLHGKHVLDIGAYDGFYSFEAERRGAARVVALDHYVWSLDLPEHIKYWQACKDKGTVPDPYHETPHWRPDELPGKLGFNTAHRALSSKVEAIVGDFLKVDVKQLGTFDVVFFLGVLYHMENPLEAMKRVAEFTKQLAIIETAAVNFPGYEHSSLCEFYESNELNNDVSNWWAPNERGLEGLCRGAGFSGVKVLIKPPAQSISLSLKSAAKFLMPESVKSLGGYRLVPARYRTVAHATK
jgi:tRNA (mo5U34)-methyltransferase